LICASRACADLERAKHPLHRATANAKLATDSQNAHAALVEAQNALFQFRPAHAPAHFILAALVVLAIAPAQLDTLGLGPCQPGIDALNNHGALELGKNA